MDDIQLVITRTKKQCKEKGGLTVSDKLAAFVSRTVIYENLTKFQLDKELTEEAIDELVQINTERLLTENEPSVETMKMQVAFDVACVEMEDKLERARQEQVTKVELLESKITDFTPKTASDFESLTLLYRNMFSYLMLRTTSAATVNQEVEREVAGALESVFPRIGLKAFVTLAESQKRDQLGELANIVMGIRLFNAELGKGAKDIEDEAGLALEESASLELKLQNEKDTAEDIVQQYTEVLEFLHYSKPEGVTEDTVARLKKELSYRQQFQWYLKSLLEDVSVSCQKITRSSDSFRREMDDLKSLVGSKTSVPKEQVYPKFDALSKWHEHLKQERRYVQSRAAAADVLLEYRTGAFDVTLAQNPNWLQEARRLAGKTTTAAENENAQEVQAASEHVLSTADKDDGVNEIYASSQSSGAEDAGAKDVGEAGAGGDGTGDTDEPKDSSSSSASGSTSKERAVRLSFESTPEFMQLPLEYRGYCPWTLVHRQGILLQGKTGLGCVRHRNAFYVFRHETALKAFMKQPEMYIKAVLKRAQLAPELIHLLSLEDHYFPRASIRGMMRGAGTGGKNMLIGDVPETKDASTGTPVHFVEKRIDPSYDWNEWSLRRKALQLANIRNRQTSGTQTDQSHFRRESETQVYLPKDKAEQTLVDSGTNPKQTVTYVAGLRGKGPGSFATKYTMGKKSAKVSVVQMTYEL